MEYANIGVEKHAKNSFRKEKRRLEYELNRDLTDTEALRILCRHAPSASEITADVQGPENDG